MIYKWDTQNKLRKINEVIAEFYGKEHQIIKTTEELGELITALMKGDREAIVEEMADVKDMLMQLESLLGIETQVQNQQKRKTTRQLLRMFEDKKRKEERCR